MGRWILAPLLVALSLFAGVGRAGPPVSEPGPNYTLFESGPVRPLALSPNGQLLFACNIPDARLEIFSVGNQGKLTHVGSVPVGLEPVAVAARTDSEVWVVNHLSDSISIVDVPSRRVTRTLLVGDEPRDLVFGGTGKSRAFITAAHRGQNRPGDPQLFDSGVGRSDVWVFNVGDLGANLGGTPLAILNLFGDTPRALAVSPNGATVYAAVFHSGDQTTDVPQTVLPTPAPTPSIAFVGPLPPSPVINPLPAPQVAVMLKYQSGTTWVDVTGTPHTDLVKFSLPDHDVFAIDANATPPAQSSVYDHVGTILFNMAVNPQSGVVYVSNTDANNFDRFEASLDPNNPTVQGELHRAQISILSGSSTVVVRRLNKHIDYSVAVAPAAVNQASLGIPTEMAVTQNGKTLYLAAFGSQEIGIFDTAQLEADTFTPSATNHVPLSAGGPGGLVLDESRARLYVYTRFDDGISTVDPLGKLETSHVTVHNPEVAAITQGRRFLYDTHLTSSNGEASCASCHVFSDFDSLAWDLGVPDGQVLANNNPFVKIGSGTTGAAIVGPVVGQPNVNVDFHPLKGPMTTQTLRGMEHDGPMHWRGDRSGGGFSNRGSNWDGDPNALDENQAFLKFNPAFIGLLGRGDMLAASEMQSFADFILKVQQPPNPIRNLDNTLTTAQATGAAFYASTISDTLKACNGCHTLDPTIGAFGTSGRSTFEGLTQHFKVPHLRNAYQKVGMWGTILSPAHGSSVTEQIRGFGYLHDGSVDNVLTFLNGGVFTFPSDPNDATSTPFTNSGAAMRKNVGSFVMAFPSDLAAVVGQQVTLTGANKTDPDVTSRLALLLQRGLTSYVDTDRSPNNECDVVVKGMIGGVTRGWFLSGTDTFTPDRSADSVQTDAGLRTLVDTSGQELTYTCAPPGSGIRMGIDRGGVGDSSQPDGILDADQCGDVTADGVAAGADVAAERALLAGASTPPAPGKCNVAGPNGTSPASCDILDVTILRRAIANLGPALTSGCNG